MSRVHFLKLFLMPSMLSGMAIIYATIFALLGGGLLYITENQLFYDYLFGTHGVVTALLQAPDSQTGIWTAISTGPFAYYALLAAASVIVGLTVLAILQGVSKIVREASFALRSINQARLSQRATIQILFERLLIRVLGVIMAVLYAILFVDVLLPLDMLLLQHGIDALDSAMWLGGVLRIAAAGLLLAICLHIHVILARLYTLRLRLFGGADAQLAAIEQD